MRTGQQPVETAERRSREARRKEGNTMTYREWIKELENEFVGRKVRYDGAIYTIATVDYNGLIHINKPNRFCETTAVYTASEARKALVTEEQPA